LLIMLILGWSLHFSIKVFSPPQTKVCMQSFGV